MDWFSRTWTWIDGKWLEGNPPMMGPRTHAAWLGSSVFDGARAFEGMMPDIEAHAQRVNDSAGKMGCGPPCLPTKSSPWRSKGRSASTAKPRFTSSRCTGPKRKARGRSWPDPDSTRFCLCLFEAPMPEPTGFSSTLSRYRRPTIETMPTDVKTGALYPNNARALRDAMARGFGNAIVLDMLGNVAETATPTCSSSVTVS